MGKVFIQTGQLNYSPDEHGGELDDGGVEEPPVRGGGLLSGGVACTRGVELQLVLVTLRDNFFEN